jgi:hypothetical protein
MKRTSSFSLILMAISGMAIAQTQPSGGWRRVGDPPPVQDEPAQQVPMAEDPSQPVARTDEYGQTQAPVQEQQPRDVRRPQDRPPAQPYGLPPQVTVPAGTFVTIRVNQPLSSDRNQEGDFFSGTLVQPLVVDGIVLAQRGQTVTGRVTEAVKAGRAQGTSRLGIQLTSISLADGTQANVHSQMVTRNGSTDVGRDVGAVATTTAVGAAIGAAADWGRGAAIGAGAGAAAGVIGVLLTRGHPTEIYPETAMTFRIDNPIQVNLARAPQAYRYVGPNEYDHPVETQLARRPPPRPVYGPYAYPYPYPYPYGYGYPYGYYPYYGGVGVGVVIRSGGYYRYGRRW